MNKEEILNRLIQKSICINAGGKGCYSPYTNDIDWFSDIDNLILMYEQLQQENRELKKQLEELKEEKQEWINLLDMFKNQQKEFIKYLEEEISKWHYNYDSNTYEYELEEPPAEKLLVSALSKYKEITGQQDGQVSGQV